MEKMTFCEVVLDQLSRATVGERDAIRSELEAHLADHAAALEEKGVAPEAARIRAEAAMGDPAEIGKALNGQFSPFWLWVKRVAQWVVCTILIIAACYWFEISGKLVTGPWDVLAGAWENWQIRQGNAWELVLKDYPVEWHADYSWNCWEVMRVGDQLVCLTRVDLEPFYYTKGGYIGHFYFCIYHEDIFAPVEGEVLTLLTVVPESGVMIDPEYNWGWENYYGPSSNGVQSRLYKGLMIFTLYESIGEWDIRNCAYLDCTGPETLHVGFCTTNWAMRDAMAYWYGRIDDPSAAAVRLDVCKGGVRQDTHTLLKEDWIQQDGMVFFALEFKNKWFESGSILRSQLLDEAGNILAVRDLDWDTINDARLSWSRRAIHQ